MSKFWGTIDRLIVGDQSRSGFVSDTKDNRVAVESEASLLGGLQAPLITRTFPEQGKYACRILIYSMGQSPGFS
ncbi:hypothetical protein M6B38_369660 [Iris pallida]|uniref:Uncharacterized protein n=1 Tax=Iris pallida TaxID=29817 RepID=A0AAX6GEJ2_IRIPA|nr:hypothetical protein M6B38_369660 [Iris pallida]